MELPEDIGVLDLRGRLSDILKEVSEGARYRVVYGHKKRPYALLVPPWDDEAELRRRLSEED